MWGILVQDNGQGICGTHGVAVGKSSINNNQIINTGFNKNCGAIAEGGTISGNLYANNLIIGSTNPIIPTVNCSGQPGTPIPSPSIVTGTFNSTNGATLANTFVNYLDNGTGNYTIPTGGFPIAKGSTTCVSGGVTPCTPTTDFTGMARPTPPSLGAYEFAMGPAVTLSPPNLAYGSRLISTSTSLPTTLTNSGGSTLSIASIGITGTNAGDF